MADEALTCKHCGEPIVKRGLDWAHEVYGYHCYAGGSENRWLPAAPAESQGVERAQPVEREECGFCDGDPDCTCPCHKAAAQPVEGPRACQRCRNVKCEQYIACACKCHAAPVEGVERVTEVAPGEYERVTDDRPAETIPERWQSVLEDINRTPTHLQNIQQTHRRVLIGELGRAETRIEVLEAALRDIRQFLKRSGYNTDLVDAALAAPSGDTTKEKV